jgi:hypothetical protein
MSESLVGFSITIKLNETFKIFCEIICWLLVMEEQ